MTNANSWQLLADITTQLQESSRKAENKIPTSTIDSIFFELEAELERMHQNGELTLSYLEGQMAACQALNAELKASIGTLNGIKHMNDHQFYCFIRLKKINTNLHSFLSRYQNIITYEKQNFKPDPDVQITSCRRMPGASKI